MEVLNNYAFTKANLVGRQAPSSQSPLVEGQTVKGESVVRFCNQDSFIPTEDRAALVTRNSAEEPWAPVTSLGQLQEILKNKDNLGERLGEWRDKKRFFFFSPDGKVGNKEVIPFSQRWAGQTLTEGRNFTDLGYRPSDDPNLPPHEATVGHDLTVATVQSDKVGLMAAAYPGKQVSLLEEPRAVTQHSIAYLTDEATGSFGFLTHNAVGGDSTEAVANLAGANFSATNVMPEAKG